jgi:lipopolysaccharide export system protein LptC
MTPFAGVLYQPMKRALRAWDRVSIYLPLVLMGALALGTYWLVRNSPVLAAPAAAAAAKHEVDYFMRQFSIKSFDEAGLLKSEVNGFEARHYVDTDILEIDKPRLRSVGEQGKLITSTSNLALSNGDGSEVQLLGNARVVREAVQKPDGTVLPRMEFTGEFLHAFVKEERIKSHKPVMLVRGGDQFTGDTFDYNNMTGVAELKGRVKGVLMPKVGVVANVVANAASNQKGKP